MSAKPIDGDIVFEHVSFGYSGEALASAAGNGAEQPSSSPVLKDISFHARPGETIAIVGQTGAGKTHADPAGQPHLRCHRRARCCVDGVDVRDWSLDSLRSQIATIEQDIFLFSRTIAENIAFGAPGEVTPRTDRSGGAAGAGPRLYQRLSRRLRNDGRRARRDALRRPAPAHRDRPRLPDRPAHPDPRRLRPAPSTARPRTRSSARCGASCRAARRC